MNFLYLLASLIIVMIKLTHSFSTLKYFSYLKSKQNLLNNCLIVRMASSHSVEDSLKPNVLIAVADGTEEMEATTSFDLLVRGGANVILASVTHSKNVVCSRGLKLTADKLIGDCIHQDWDLIVCPGGLPGSQHLSDSEIFIKLLKHQDVEGKLIGAICAAPAIVLSKHGLLKDKNATCYPDSKLISKIQHYVDEEVVVDGNIITSRGPGTAINFSLRLVEILFGEAQANRVKNQLANK